MFTSATKTDANGNVSVLSTADNIVDITVATTLTIADSGKICVLKAAAGAAITLPAVTAGKWGFRFVTGLAFASTAWTVVSTTAVIQGGAIVNSTFVPAANENTITFVASAETLGDFVDVYSDGTNIYVNGVATAAGAITFTAA
jgi:hypothetical protein